TAEGDPGFEALEPGSEERASRLLLHGYLGFAKRGRCERKREPTAARLISDALGSRRSCCGGAPPPSLDKVGREVTGEMPVFPKNPEPPPRYPMAHDDPGVRRRGSCGARRRYRFRSQRPDRPGDPCRSALMASADLGKRSKNVTTSNARPTSTGSPLVTP